MQLIEVGEIGAIHGLKGEVRASYWTDSAQDFVRLKTLYKKEGTPLQITGARAHKNVIILSILGVNTPEAAQLLVGQTLFANRSDFSLPEGTYFQADLIGLAVINTHTLRCYGVVTQVDNNGANDYYTVRGDGVHYYIPAIKQVIDRVDLQEKKLFITPLKGLIDDED